MLPALKVGGLYQASVVGRADDGRILIALGGEIMRARSRTDVPRGTRVTVEVETLVPVVVLRIVQNSRQEVPAGG
mgnify:CR=1 FL=1